MKEQVLFWKSKTDIYAPYKEWIDVPAIREMQDAKEALIYREHWEARHQLFKNLPLGEDIPGLNADFSQDAVTLGQRADLNDQQVADLEALAKGLIPWRKGPFNLFGLEIDTEWRSNLKWDRLAPHLDLKGKRVADVGCGNGYYMWRMLGQEPDLVVGMDPSEKFFHDFHLLQRFVQAPQMDFLMAGVEQLHWFPGFFDVLICMGVIYHQKHPDVMLQNLWDATLPGGQVIVETLGIEGDDPVALYPEGRYAKMRNVHYVPTASCLINWMQRIGFEDIELISAEKTTIEEQRGTDWMLYESLPDFLDPNDHNKTIEGYPAPWRFMVKAKKAKCKLNEAQDISVSIP